MNTSTTGSRGNARPPPTYTRTNYATSELPPNAYMNSSASDSNAQRKLEHRHDADCPDESSVGEGSGATVVSGQAEPAGRGD
ncbi:hypothetical protein PsYK624_050080 [Phanerochaete sordida]|uniref:Uncharacterized protein n=1 Tax=Phanerochaete sordida TaxID=48140 RepID=A0A9P3G7H5_9APHY|nr:hypothetical protein PsYK624_050080 [Phanerochaete sordida]